MSLATEIAGKLNYLNTQDNVAVNATLPYSGYTQVSKKLDNFVFQTSSSFLNKVADKNRYVKFGEKVVDTYGPELVTNGDFSDGTTGWSNIYSTSIFTVIDGEFNTNGWAVYTIPLIVGKTYNFRYTAECLSPYYGVVRIGLTGTSSEIYANNSIYKKEMHTVTFTATTTSAKISVLGRPEANIKLDNISVREIQTADFTNIVPDVSEIITNGSNTTSVAVSAGDYVVDGSELWNNPVVDSGWTDNGNGSYTSSGLYDYLTVSVDTYIDVKYFVTVTIDSYTSGELRVPWQGGGSDPYKNVSGVGVHTLAFTSIKNDNDMLIYSNAFIGTISNISVRRVSDTFRAKQDAPIGTALTNTTYFEDRTSLGVTNQALAYHTYNTLTNAYEGIKTEVLFSDVSKEDLLDNSVWMARNGFSKVSEFLYSKGSYLVVPVGIWQS